MSKVTRLFYLALKTFQKCHFRYRLCYDRAVWPASPNRRHSPLVLYTARCICSVCGPSRERASIFQTHKVVYNKPLNDSRWFSVMTLMLYGK